MKDIILIDNEGNEYKVIMKIKESFFLKGQFMMYNIKNGEIDFFDYKQLFKIFKVKVKK